MGRLWGLVVVAAWTTGCLSAAPLGGALELERSIGALFLEVEATPGGPQGALVAVSEARCTRLGPSRGWRVVARCESGIALAADPTGCALQVPRTVALEAGRCDVWVRAADL